MKLNPRSLVVVLYVAALVGVGVPAAFADCPPAWNAQIPCGGQGGCFVYVSAKQCFGYNATTTCACPYTTQCCGHDITIVDQTMNCPGSPWTCAGCSSPRKGKRVSHQAENPDRGASAVKKGTQSKTAQNPAPPASEQDR